VEFNRASVCSLESTPRGRGNGGAEPLWKGKWRWCVSGCEVALNVMAAGLPDGGGVASNRRRDTKEERAEWAAKAGWAGFRNGKRK
jgi:hypothetical protein